jgi:predicted permease
MNDLKTIRAWLRALFRKRKLDAEMDDEIRSHVEMQMQENLEAGMAPDEARYAALRQFESVESTKESCREQRGFHGAETLVGDVRFALRMLRKNLGFTIVSVLTLALGIGANVVVFGIVNAVLLKPLDVNDPQNLYQFRLKPWTSFKLLTTSYPAFEDFRQRNTAFSDIAGFNGYSQARLSWGNSVRRVAGYAVTGNYFELLGVQPEVGRFFQAADEHGPNSAPYVVLSHNLWRSAFNADPGIVGTTVRLDKDQYTVVAVAPALFHGTEQFVWPDYWIPFVNWGSDVLDSRTSVSLTMLGRLKPGVTPRQATENLDAIAAQLAKEYPKTDTGVPLRLVRPGLYADDGDVIRGFLYSVTGLTLLVLVAACANLASLFAARAADRSRQLALRVALGASRWRLVRQLMTEAMVLSLLGGGAGLVTAGLLLGVLNRWQSSYGHLAVSVDARVYLAALTLTLISALLFGMIPSRQVWRSSPLQAMKGGAVESMPLHRFALRDLLLGAQIAICMLLVTASLVAVRGMVRMLHAPLGFQPQGVMLADTDLSLVEPGGDLPLEKKKAMIEAVRNIPGVAAAGTVNRVPFTGGLRGVPVFQPGTTEFTLNNSVLAPYVFTVSPGYLEAAGTRLLGGRDVSWHDTPKTPYVAIVNETFARQMWGDTLAIGQRFIVSGHLREVVGVAEDGKYHNMQESPQPVAYLSLSQNERSKMIFVARSRRAQNEMAAALERTLSGLEPNAQIKVQSWLEALGGTLFPARAATASLGVMGLLAAMLAVTGILGMAAYNVSRRMKELGIRMALGARTTHVMGAAVGRPIVLLGVGSLVGLLLGVFASGLLGQIVYQANPRDPVVVVSAVLTMVLLGIAASALPAMRALAVDPSKLMREE